MKMRADNILVEPLPWSEKQKVGSIYLPDQIRELFIRGTVKEVGPGLWSFAGTRPPIEVDVGDCVLYGQTNKLDIIVGEKRMHIVHERDIIAILEEGDFGESKIITGVNFQGETDATS